MQLPAKRLCKAANGKRNSAPWSGGVSADVRALMWQLAADRRQRSWRRVIGTLTLARRQHIELDVFVYGAATSVYAESSQWSLAEEIFEQVRSGGLQLDMVLRRLPGALPLLQPQ
mmetsp:Transcript_49510/g.102131  ORF Transcript_49510/g.102131 Transcript_49510/m.102131 type:complete len:115 (+) Transcript_49510:92-436(+)